MGEPARSRGPEHSCRNFLPPCARGLSGPTVRRVSSRELFRSAGSALLRLATATVAVLGAVLAVAALTGLDRSWLGREFMLVTSGSMSPALSPGDVVVVRTDPVPGDRVEVGDVITFRPRRGGTAVTHRVVDVRPGAAGEMSYVTKGDANRVVDTVAVTDSEIVGQVESVLPAGRLLTAMTDPRIAVPVVLAVLLLEAALIVRPGPAVATNDPAEKRKANTPGGTTT